MLFTIISKSPSLSKSAYVAPLEKFLSSSPQSTDTSEKVRSLLFLNAKFEIASDGI